VSILSLPICVKRWRAGLSALCAALVCCWAPSTAAAQRVTEVPVFVVKHREAAVYEDPGILHWETGIELPAGAKDGAPWWYLVHLRLRFQGAQDVPRDVEVSALVNRAASNSIELRLRSSKQCPEGEVSWSSLDLLHGFHRGRRCGSVLPIRSVNFTQLRAVRPGAGILAISVQGNVSPADGLDVLPGTGIFKSRSGPAKLAFAKVDKITNLPVERWTKVPLRLVNRGDRPVRVRSVSANSERGLTVQPPSKKVGKVILPGHSSHDILFQVRPRQPGRFQVVFSASSTANTPGVELSLVAGSESSAGVDIRELALGSVVVCAAMLIAVRRILT